MFAILNILDTGVFAGIDLLDLIELNCVVEDIIDLGRLALNSYISSSSSIVFWRFYRIVDVEIFSILVSVGDALSFSLIYLFCVFCDGISVASSSARSSLFSIFSLFWLKIAILVLSSLVVEYRVFPLLYNQLSMRLLVSRHPFTVYLPITGRSSLRK